MLSQDSRPTISYHVVRITLGLVYFHFGFLKFFPDLSPAELLASQTIIRLTGGMLDASEALFCLAIMEVALGLALIFNVWMRFTFVLFIFHMIGTFSPIVVLPELAFKIFPFAPTMEGQYILKNIVFVAAGWGVLAPHLFAKKTVENVTELEPSPTSDKRKRDAVRQRPQPGRLDPVPVPATAAASFTHCPET